MANDSNDKNTKPVNGQLVEERRKFIRLNINVQIRFSVIEDYKTQKIAETKDIGAGGICFILDEELKKGDALKLDLFLPEDPPTIQALRRVVWIKPFSIASEKNTRYDTGIEFTEIDYEDRKKINKYVFSLKLR